MKPYSILNPNKSHRRECIQTSAATVLALLISAVPIMADQLTSTNFDKIVPADKKLSTEWVNSLTERGESAVLRGKDLKFVGMPVGGICAGQLYLGGDGRLWYWDIFNRFTPPAGDDEHYKKPMLPSYPLKQSFSLKVGDQKVSLDSNGFSDVTFRGEYPVGTVNYSDSKVPATVKLEAFSPFIPLNTDDSSLPATVFQFTVKNTSATTMEATLCGELENGVCLNNRSRKGVLNNRLIKKEGLTLLLYSAEEGDSSLVPTVSDVVFEDWQRDNYDGWHVEGTAFGNGPVRKSEMPSYQRMIGGVKERLVNSHASAPGNSRGDKDAATGRLRSRDFTIDRNYIEFCIGGGKASPSSRHGLWLVVDGKPVLGASGKDSNEMFQHSLDVHAYAGKTAHIEIVDEATGGWGNIGVGKITFTNDAPGTQSLKKLPDFGTMALAVLGNADEESGNHSAPFSEKLIGSLGQKLALAPGESKTVTFIVTWNFPNDTISKTFADSGRYYASKFSSAQAVAEYVAGNFPRLDSQTKLWRNTWYDSTLPYWFLDRTFLNTSILATSTCHRLMSGRFWAWEGVNSCPGTCTSVWYYAQAMARLFPDMERSVREMQDFADGIGFDPATGGIWTRAEFRGDFVLDGQAGNILRAYREHQMSKDNTFLKRNWAKIKKATQWLVQQDGNNDGVIDGWQSTTLDAGHWWGAMSWTSSLYLAALHAARQMALEMDDTEFALTAKSITDVGGKNLVDRLWNGEYFFHKPDPTHPNSFIIGNGCHIDQVYGQCWANQVGLGRVLPKEQTLSALRSIWKYNFDRDVGPFRSIFKQGRWYALPGESGTIITTWPHGDREYPKKVEGRMELGVGFLNECMNGFEHQVAGHMIREGMVIEGLAVERAVHDRYNASKRNPWNELECGDHYSRSMASYGVFLDACGFEYNGPRGHIGFAPKIHPEDFKAAFTAAEGWGSYSQKITEKEMNAALAVKWGKVTIQSFGLSSPKLPLRVTAMLDGKEVPAEFSVEGEKVTVRFSGPETIPAGGNLCFLLSWSV
jgi:uncharacterized protein (DUF608 family)